MQIEHCIDIKKSSPISMFPFEKKGLFKMEKQPIIKRREYLSIILFQKIHSLIRSLHEDETRESSDLLFKVGTSANAVTV